MNSALFELSPVTVELFQVHDVLRAVLHTVLFHRCLGVVRPREADSGLFELTYARVDDAGLEASVEGRIRDILAWAEENRSASCATVTLSFFETRQRQGWLSSSEERMTWELWRLPLWLVRPAHSHAGEAAAADARAARHTALEADLKGVLLHILAAANERRDHLPPVSCAGVVSYPFEIALSVPNEDAFGVGALSRLVASSAPPSLL